MAQEPDAVKENFTLEAERAAIAGVWTETTLYIDREKVEETAGIRLTFFGRWAVLQYKSVLRPPSVPPASRHPAATARAKALGGYPFLLRYELNLATTPRQMRLVHVGPNGDEQGRLQVDYRLSDGRLILGYEGNASNSLGSVHPKAAMHKGKRWVHVLEAAKPPRGDDAGGGGTGDRARFFGRWRETSIAINDQWPPSDQRGARVTYGPGWLVFEQQKLRHPQLAAYHVDDQAEPKCIDWEVFTPSGQTMTTPGIYTFAGDALLILQPIAVGSGARRPRTFQTEPADGVVKRIYERVE